MAKEKKQESRAKAKGRPAAAKSLPSAGTVKKYFVKQHKRGSTVHWAVSRKGTEGEDKKWVQICQLKDNKDKAG